MRVTRPLSFTLSIALIAMLALATNAAAQGGPGGPGGPGGNGLRAAGNYHITTLTASYFFCCGDPSQPSFSVDITDTTTVANPAVGATASSARQGTSATVTHETDVFINACGGSNFICGGGCFIPANASDFTFGSGLSSAVLKTSFDPTTSATCQNFPVSLPAFTVDVTWSGTSSVASTRTTSTYSCVGYKAEVQTLTSNNNAPAIATSSLLSGSVAASGSSLGRTDQHVHAQGVAQDACSSLGLGGGGKGAGPGPLGNGGFEFADQSAGVSLPSGFLSLTSVTNTSRPSGTPPSTTTETDLTVVSFGFPFVFICVQVQPPSTFAFGSGLSSASVHAAIDPSMPACTGFTNGFFTSFSVDLTWTATGPLASIHSTAISDCGAFHEEMFSDDATNPASASGTVSMFPDPISTGQASINTFDHRFHLQGGSPQGCLQRP